MSSPDRAESSVDPGGVELWATDHRCDIVLARAATDATEHRFDLVLPGERETVLLGHRR